MSDMEIALNAAIFAINAMIDRGSITYTIKNRSGEWVQMDWIAAIRKLLVLLKLVEYKEEEKK